MRYLKRHSKGLNGLLNNVTSHRVDHIQFLPRKRKTSLLLPDFAIYGLAKVSFLIHDDAAVLANWKIGADYSSALRVDGDVRRVLSVRGEGQVGVWSDGRESMPGS